MNKNFLKIFQQYLSKEIGIEFKACLYFFCILFYYSMYRLANGSVNASIIHMAEIIFTTYFMGYAQVYLLSNFDEGDCLRLREIFYIVLCSIIYTAISYVGNWFDRNVYVSIGFVFYMVFAYVCAFWVYKIKRTIDGKFLNDDLKKFQERKQDDNE